MKKKVRIKGLPTGQSGLEVKMNHLRAGLGFNSNVMPWPIMAGKMSAPPLKVNSKLQPVDREEANLEAEKDEVAMIPGQGSIPDTYTIGGKRHTQGGTPLNLPEDSFIFSDTAKMRIKDPVVLAQFGLPERKMGYTPAEIAKKYNTAPYKKLLADKNTDAIQRETAETMLANYNLKLAKLALIQESMKGFPQGIPQIAMPYLEAMQINPEDLMQQNPGAPQDAEDAAGQESAMQIGGPVMAQQPGSPLQYLQDGGPDYFAMGGLKRYQDAGAVEEEPNRYKDITDFDNLDLNNPYHFYNIEQKIWDKNKSYREPQVGKKAVQKLDKNIALINSYKETQPEVYKNLLPTLDRLIKSKQQAAEYAKYWDNEDDAKSFGEPYVHPDIQAASDAYPVKPAKEPRPGFGGEDEGYEENFAKNYKDYYEAYLKALDSKNPKEMAATADFLKNAAGKAQPEYSKEKNPYFLMGVPDVLYSSKLNPASDADKFQDLANILYERAYPKTSKSNPKVKNTEDQKVQESAIKIYDELNKQYQNAPTGTERLKAKEALQNFSKYHPDNREKTPFQTDVDEFGITMPATDNPTGVMYSTEDRNAINEMQKVLFPEMYKKNAQTSNSTKTTTTAPGVIQAGAPRQESNMSAAPTKTMSIEEYKKMKGYKKFGGSTKKVRITGLPGMAYGGSLDTYQGGGIPTDSPLMSPGMQFNFNNPNYAAQAAINTNYRLDANIPDNSPLKKPATKLDFTASDATKPADNTAPQNLAYKDWDVKWKQKNSLSGPAKAAGIMGAEGLAASIFRRKEYNDLMKKEKDNQFNLFTPVAGGDRGHWSQSASSYGLIDPNSNPVQQPGYMTMRRNTFGYPNREFGGAMDNYKLGGYVKNGNEWGAWDDNVWVTMSRSDYDNMLAAEKAATAAPTNASSGKPATAPKKPATPSTIGVYSPEWTSYLTKLAKEAGVSMDDPRFKAKLPSYFFDDKGKMRSKEELDKLSRAAAMQKQLSSGAFGEDYWNDQYQPDFKNRHKALIDKFEKEHPGEKFDPTKLDMAMVNGKPTESSHMKWFQDEYNKMAKEKGAPVYDFGKANKFGRLSYSVPSLQDFEEPAKEVPAAPADTKTEATNLPPDIAKYKHLAQPRINTPAFGWTFQDLNNLGRAAISYATTKKHMPYEATPNFYQADTVFDDPTRRIAAMNEQRNIGAQNMAGFTNPQAYMANFLAGNNLDQVANAISDVHGRNINTANQRDMYNAQALNAFDAERANRQTRLYDKNTLAQVAYEAERAAKGDIMGQMANTGMKNAADIYNINQMYPQFAVSPFLQTMYHKNPRDIKPKYEQEKDLAKTYNEILSTYENLNQTPEGRKVAYEAAKQKLGIQSTAEDPYLQYQRARALDQTPQYNPYATDDQQS